MEYLHFIFDGVSSKKYNLIIQNRGEDLSYASQPSFENKTASPLYQGTSYLLGVNKKEKTFSFNCWVSSITNEKLREMINWISVDKIADLILDYNPNFKYKVKVSSISDFKHLPVNEDLTGNYEFSLTFQSVGNANSESIQNVNFTLTDLGLPSTKTFGVNSDNNGPVVLCEGSNIKFINYYTSPFHLEIITNSTTTFTISKESVTHYSYQSSPTGSIFKINTEHGFVLVNDKLAEGETGITATTNLGPLLIESSEIQSIVSKNFNLVSLTLTMSGFGEEIKYPDISNLYVLVQKEEPDTNHRIFKVNGLTSNNYTATSVFTSGTLDMSNTVAKKFTFFKPVTLAVSGLEGSTQFNFRYRDKI